MKYGYFDDANREYVIDRIDVPVSWTNYIGVKDMCGVFNHTAGGYLFYKSPEFHRITRFRPNGVPMDRPGHYVYIRDDDTGDYWTISWQPVGKSLDSAKYVCKHGLSYIKYQCEYSGICGEQTIFIPLEDPVEVWDVKLRNDSGRKRRLSVFGYAEFSFHLIQSDNQNFQMSLYCAGSSYEDGIMETDLFYEAGGFQYFTANSAAGENDKANFDCLRDVFIGPYRTETNPIAVESGKCTGSFELGGNHCGGLRRVVELEPGADARLIFLLGEGNRVDGKAMRSKYCAPGFSAVDTAFKDLANFWKDKLEKLQISTPHDGMNSMINTWTLYQAEINVMFSRFASFIEVGGRTGLGYRDTSQDAMMVPHSNPQKSRSRLVELLKGLTTDGYGLHLFTPVWFEKKTDAAFKSPTVVPRPSKDQMIHGVKDACADDALWLIPSIVEFIRESGEVSFADEMLPYADTFDPETGKGKSETVFDHMKRILDFSAKEVGAHGICKGLRADWNDCLNLGGGESAMVSFLHHWALTHFIALGHYLKRDVSKYEKMAKKVKESCERELWNGSWYTRGITASGKKIGAPENKEGKVHMESNTWAVLSGAASHEHGKAAMDAVDEYLYTEYGLMLCQPAFSEPDDQVGFVTRVYKGLKENAAIFSHPNPWAWAAETVLGRGDRAMKFYDALCPYNQNDKIEIRNAEPYMYCQFVVGKDHNKFGRAHHPFMTGSAGWSYFAATRFMLGIQPDFDNLNVNPCIPTSWPSYSVRRVWRGAVYNITIENPKGISKGVKECTVNGKPAKCGGAGAEIPVQAKGSENNVKVVMG
ncbi:MAG: N,N'-diacetylchitobiose phosphorylase [Treponema sp.]|jgi:N,N'-diacetylchitobiose phosphorylase|nr:N,N'-diacetylchitobiose phosphorylase [Treponema sp.]